MHISKPAIPDFSLSGEFPLLIFQVHYQSLLYIIDFIYKTRAKMMTDDSTLLKTFFLLMKTSQNICLSKYRMKQ